MTMREEWLREWVDHFHSLTTEKEKEAAWVAVTPELWQLLVDWAATLHKQGLSHHCDDIAEDAAADVLAIFYRKVDTINTSQSILSWLHVVLRRRLIDIGRRKTARPERPTEDFLLFHRLTPVYHSYGAEHDDLHRALAKLTDSERAILVGMYVLCLPGQVLAQKLGIKYGTLKSRAARLIGRLRAELAASPADE